MSRILIIEDEEAIAELEKDYLELSNFEVDIEADGEKGLQKALAGNYDMYILDLMLPGVDGFELCKRIREVKNVPILMVTAKKEEIDKIIFAKRACRKGEGASCQIREIGSVSCHQEK